MPIGEIARAAVRAAGVSGLMRLSYSDIAAKASARSTSRFV
jgi:hypothetical protein